jgi:hypothetical protein
MGDNQQSHILWQQRVRQEDTSRARFLRWYQGDKWSNLAKPNPWDTEDTAMEAMHGYYRLEEGKAPYVQSPEARMRATRRARIGTGTFDPGTNLAFRPRDHGGVYLSLHDVTMTHILKFPPSGDRTVPTRLPRPASAGEDTQLTVGSLAKSASQPGLSALSGSRAGRSRLSRTASSAGLSRVEILERALGEGQAKEPSVAASQGAVET